MKKFFVLAAVAMVAFAGCKKEESAVMLKVGIEDATSMDKQTYNVQLNRVLFDNNDMGMIINGNTLQLSLLNESSYGTSNKAEVGPISFQNGDEFLAGYPASVFDAVNGDEWPLAMPMANNVAMVEDHDEYASEAGDISIDGDYRAWPMVSYNECGPCVAQQSWFELKNTVAILSPAIDYGYNWIAEMVRSKGLLYDLSTYHTNNDLPDITIRGIEIISTNEPLCGAAYVKDVKTANPTLWMDRSAYADQANYSLSLNAYSTISHTQNPNFLNTNIIGQIPIAKFQQSTALIMKIHFTILDQNYVYESNPRTFGIDETARSQRTVLVANFRDESTVARITSE